MATFSKLHSSTLLCFIVCLLCILAFFIVGIFPNVKNLKELDASIAELNTEAKQQELLFPVYTRLIKKIQNRPPALSLPPKTKLDQEAFARIDKQFIKMAKNSGIVLDSAVPDATSYLQDSGQLTMDLIFHGDFFNFQKLLMDICQIPYLIAIDELDINPHIDGKQMKLKIRLDQE